MPTRVRARRAQGSGARRSHGNTHVPGHKDAHARALERTYAEIRAQRTTEGLKEALMPFGEFNALIGLEDRYAIDERYRP